MKVGNHEPREVSDLNHTLYWEARKILEEVNHRNHSGSMGWCHVGNFIDWLEETYTIVKKDT